MVCIEYMTAFPVENLENNFRKKILYIVLLVLLILGVYLFTNRNEVAVLVWNNTHNVLATSLLNSDSSELGMEMGRYYFNGPGGYHLTRASRGFREAISVDTEDASAHYALSRVLFVIGDFDNAREEILLSLKYDPKNLRAYYVKGLIESYDGNLEESESDFSRFIEWAPKEWAGYNDLAWVELRQGKFEEALETTQNGLLETDDSNMWLLSNKGLALLNLDRFKEAQITYENVIEASRHSTEKEWKDAYPGNSSSERLELREVFEAVLLFNYGNVYRGLDDTDTALENYREAYNLLPNTSEIGYMIQDEIDELISVDKEEGGEIYP